MVRRSLNLSVAEHPGVKSRLLSSKLYCCRLGTRYSHQLHQCRCSVHRLDKNHVKSGLPERRMLQLQHMGSDRFLMKISRALKRHLELMEH